MGRISGVDFEPATGNGDYWYDGLPNNDKRKARTIKHITKNNSMSFAYSDREKIGVRIAISFDDIEDFDIDKMAALACEKSSNSVIINDNILEINFMPNQFDFILAMAVIHNFPEKDLIKLLKKIKIWLKEDGFFILDTTNNPITETGFFEKEDYNNNVVRYRRKWKKEDLELFMKNQGFYIQDSFVYKDETSNKEWLIYSFKVSKID